jgi:hypothetical protein
MNSVLTRPAARLPRRAATLDAIDRPDDPTAAKGLRPTPTLLLLASMVVSFLAASSAPTPLYAVYAR